MDLKQDFWSILGQSTNFAFSLLIDLKVNMTRVKAIPVAIGTNKQPPPKACFCIPLIDNVSNIIYSVNLAIKDDPAA